MLAGIVTVRFLNLVKFLLKSAGIVTSKFVETSQGLAEEHCAGMDSKQHQAQSKMQ